METFPFIQGEISPSLPGAVSAWHNPGLAGSTPGAVALPHTCHAGTAPGSMANARRRLREAINAASSINSNRPGRWYAPFILFQLPKQLAAKEIPRWPGKPQECQRRALDDWITLVLRYCYPLLSLASADRYDFFASLNTESLRQFACFKVSFPEGSLFLSLSPLSVCDILRFFIFLFAHWCKPLCTAATFKILPQPLLPSLCLWPTLHSIIQPRNWVWITRQKLGFNSFF